MDEFVSIARIVKTRGLRGEVAADLLTDFPDRFETVQRVRVLREGREYWEELESYWFQKNRIILKFAGRDTPEAAAELVWGDVQIPEANRVELPPDQFFHDQLIGCQVIENNRKLGEVVDLLELASDVVNLVCRSEAGQEFMIPLVQEFVIRIDVMEKVLDVQLPPGLIDF